MSLTSVINASASFVSEISLYGLRISTFAPQLLCYRLLGDIKRGEGEPIVFFPGFGTPDLSTLVLRQTLNFFGYNAHPWRQGWNHGNFEKLESGLLKELTRLYDIYGKLTLGGWSMGGRMACAMAARYPELVTQVITICAPLQPVVYREIPTHFPRRIRNVFHRVQLELSHEAELPDDIPVVSIAGKHDKLIIPECARNNKAHFVDVRVSSGHLDVGVSAEVIRIIATCLGNADILQTLSQQWQHTHTKNLLAAA